MSCENLSELPELKLPSDLKYIRPLQFHSLPGLRGIVVAEIEIGGRTIIFRKDVRRVTKEAVRIALREVAVKIHGEVALAK